MSVGAERLRYVNTLDRNKVYQNIDVRGILPIDAGEVVMCVEDEGSGGVYHTYKLDAFGSPFAIPEDIRGRYPVSFRTIVKVLPPRRGSNDVTRAATTFIMRVPGLPRNGPLGAVARGMLNRAANQAPSIPKTLFDNLLRGFPVRGCPISLGGLR